MTFTDYQKFAELTKIYPNQYKVVYPSLGAAGEIGELCNKVKKKLRDNLSWEDIKTDLFFEIGDVLWYISALATDLDFNLDEIAEANIKKLNSRKERGVLCGSGDNR